MTAEATGKGAVEVTVRGLAVGGSGVADLPDGRVVFVPRTAPGDHARIRIEKSKRRWAVGSLERVTEPGPYRVEAPCPLYARCGGCQLQHLSYEHQVEWKGRFVADALERIGGLSRVEPPEVVPSPRRLRYRNRITFTLRRLHGGHVVAGFHALGRPAHVLDVHGECLLPREPLIEAWTALREAWGAGAELLPSAGRLRLTLRQAGDTVELIVAGGAEGWDAGPLAAAVPGISAVWHEAGEGGAGATLLAGDPSTATGPAFEQVNPEAAESLRAHVLEQASRDWSRPLGEDATRGRVVDAYCGTGEYGRALAERGWSVRGIEVDRWAAAEAEKDAPEGFEVVRGRVEEALAASLPADLLVANPPRSGLGGEVVEAVRARPTARLIYVSCDPATLARDLAALLPTYELGGLRSFDLFPQTAHVETVATLTLRTEGA